MKLDTLKQCWQKIFSKDALLFLLKGDWLWGVFFILALIMNPYGRALYYWVAFFLTVVIFPITYWGLRFVFRKSLKSSVVAALLVLGLYDLYKVFFDPLNISEFHPERAFIIVFILFIAALLDFFLQFKKKLLFHWIRVLSLLTIVVCFIGFLSMQFLFPARICLGMTREDSIFPRVQYMNEEIVEYEFGGVVSREEHEEDYNNTFHPDTLLCNIFNPRK